MNKIVPSFIQRVALQRSACMRLNSWKVNFRFYIADRKVTIQYIGIAFAALLG